MPLAAFTAIDALWVCLSVFLIVVAVAMAFLFLRLATTARRLTSLIEGLEDSVVPLVTKTGGTIDRVNLQLDKVDLVTDSAVSAADSADTAVRAVSLAITRPVQKASALAKGISHAASAVAAGHDLKSAVEAGKDAARRREAEIAEELARKDRRLAAPGLDRPVEPAPAAAAAAAPAGTADEEPTAESTAP
jgi:uncharacterized protein YoxC